MFFPKTVETALGRISADELGFVLSHEHLLVSLGNEWRHYPWRVDLVRAREIAIAEVRQAMAGGVRTIVDLTTPDLGRNIGFIREVAEATGLHVIVATGIWRDIPRSFWQRDIDDIASIFEHEISIGIEGTDIRAGVIKVANDAEGVTPEGERILRGAARASRRTGCPVSTHQWAPGEVGRRQVEILEDEGVSPDRVCIGHSADTIDVDFLEDLLRRGVYLSMDRYPGRPPLPDSAARNRTLKALIERGWSEMLMVGHDYTPAEVLHGRPSASPEPTRLLHLSTVALPALAGQGVQPADIRQITHDSPRRFLAGLATTRDRSGTLPHRSQRR